MNYPTAGELGAYEDVSLINTSIHRRGGGHWIVLELFQQFSTPPLETVETVQD
jgi:hypothetical protein